MIDAPRVRLVALFIVVVVVTAALSVVWNARNGIHAQDGDYWPSFVLTFRTTQEIGMQDRLKNEERTLRLTYWTRDDWTLEVLSSSNQADVHSAQIVKNGTIYWYDNVGPISADVGRPGSHWLPWGDWFEPPYTASVLLRLDGWNMVPGTSSVERTSILEISCPAGPTRFDCSHGTTPNATDRTVEETIHSVRDKYGVPISYTDVVDGRTLVSMTRTKFDVLSGPEALRTPERNPR